MSFTQQQSNENMMLSNYDANLIHFVYSQQREQEDWQTASIPHADNAGFQWIPETTHTDVWIIVVI